MPSVEIPTPAPKRIAVTPTARASVKQAKREMMFIQMLEGLHEGEAEVLCLAKDKTIGKRWKITKACVEEAFPSIQWGGRS